MKDREQRRYDMFTRVDAFGRDYLADLKPDSKGAVYRMTVAEVIAKLDENKVLQVHPRTVAVEVQFDGLLLDLKAIAKTARAIEQDAPGFAEPFFIGESNPASLLATADRFIAALQKRGVAERFIAHEIAPDFAKNLATEVTTIRESQSYLNSGNTTAVAKTKAIGLSVAEGIKAVNYLDAIVTNKYGRNAEVLRAWQAASHVERAPQREKKVPVTNGSVVTA